MPTKMTSTISVKGNINEIFDIWANFENFPVFMKNIKSIKKTGYNSSHWIMEGPLGQQIEWDAHVTKLEPPKRIAWNSLHGDIKTSGEVTFNDITPEQIQVTVEVQYVAPAGKLGDAAAHLVDSPEKKLNEDLKRFKEYVESNTAKIPTMKVPST